MLFDSLTEPVKRALQELGFKEPTPPQTHASSLIAEGLNVLICAPTGSGKTEAAIIPVFNSLIKEGTSGGISVLYITPMRALNRDMMLRLEFWASRLNLKIEVRHGDTPASQRRKQSTSPPNILITTPETLQAILPGERMSKHLRSLKCVIVDEVHNLVESKRGVQLCVGLERLRNLSGEFQLIGLSATLGSPEEASRFLFGPNRAARIIRVDAPKKYEYVIDHPLLGEGEDVSSRGLLAPPELAARLVAINDLIDAHDSVLIFVNSRTVAEMLGEKLCRMRTDVAVHHGSLPREERERVEESFKRGELKALVCTSTLELGIDIGAVDAVIQYMSPRQVTSLIQRVGRSGHSLTRKSDGVIVTVSADDILESSAVILLSQEGRLEPSRPYRNSLDVLAHQTVGYLMDLGAAKSSYIFEEVKKTHPYCNLDSEAFERTVKFLSGLNKIRVDGDMLRKTRSTAEYYFENLSMIPDETRYFVIDATTNQRVGILGDEFMLLKARIGLHFICKGHVWQIEKISDDRKVYVTPVDDPLAAVPGWDGEMLPVPFELAQRTGSLRGTISQMLEIGGIEDAVVQLGGILPAPPSARRKVVEEIKEQKEMSSSVPTDTQIVLEGFQKYLVVHSCFGEAVNRTLGYAFEEVLSWRGLVRNWWADGYRILLELTVDTAEYGLETLKKQLLLFSEGGFDEVFWKAVQRNFPFPGRVKTVAERFGALRRGKYVSHPNLCSLPTRFENTVVYEEALHEIERDLIDLERTREVIHAINSGQLEVATYQAEDKPSPIAYHILYRYLDVPELVAPDSLARTGIQRLKAALLSTVVDLLCFTCRETQRRVVIGELGIKPVCMRCGSTLLSPVFWQTSAIEDLLRKKMNRIGLSKDEQSDLARARRAADLVLAYGRSAVVAQSVYGVGPQTASKILAKMHEDEESFYKDLLDAKLKFISTRQYWDD